MGLLDRLKGKSQPALIPMAVSDQERERGNNHLRRLIGQLTAEMPGASIRNDVLEGLQYGSMSIGMCDIARDLAKSGHFGAASDEFMRAAKIWSEPSIGYEIARTRLLEGDPGPFLDWPKGVDLVQGVRLRGTSAEQQQVMAMVDVWCRSNALAEGGIPSDNMDEVILAGLNVRSVLQKGYKTPDDVEDQTGLAMWYR